MIIDIGFYKNHFNNNIGFNKNRCWQLDNNIISFY